MRLVVMTPQSVVVDRDVVHVRAEDESGAFGVLDGHADFITALAVSVLVYRDLDRHEHFVALRGGLCTVTDGLRVDVITREAVVSDDLTLLKGEVLTRLRRGASNEELARRGAGKLEGALLRRVTDYVRVAHRGVDEGTRRWRA